MFIKRWIWLIFIFSCKTTSTPIASEQRIDISITLPTMTREELTAAHLRDSLRIDELENNVRNLSGSNFGVDSAGNIIIKGNLNIDTLRVITVYVTGILKDTTNPHDGNDTLIHAPN